MSTIYLSLSSRDIAIAEQVKARLEQWGHGSVFLDFDPENGIPAGRDWEKDLYARLRECRAVIVLCSHASMASRWCFAEITHAKALGKPVLPIKIDDARVDPILLGKQVIDATTGWEEAYQRLKKELLLAGLDPKDLFDWDGTRPPYPGLPAFQEQDAAIFFGREKEIIEGQALLNRLQQFGGARLIVMLGASGSGKSSLMRAGLLPRLKRDPRWLVIDPFRPLRTPFDELARVLSQRFSQITQAGRSTRADVAHIRDRIRWKEHDTKQAVDMFLDLIEELRANAGSQEATVLLMIDQYEELLATDANEEAARFLGFLRAVLDRENSGLLVLTTLRSDFLGLFQDHPAMRWWRVEVFPIPLMAVDDFVAVIEGPARVAGMELGTGLVQAMIRDTKTADALPLLAFTLRELYEGYGQDKLLTLEKYRDQLGGLDGCIARAAEAVLTSRTLSEKETTDLRTAFLAMVRVHDNDRYMKQAVLWNNLPSSIHIVLERFVTARLLIIRDEADGPTLEIAHEALIRSWFRLQQWLQEDRGFLVWRQRLRSRVEEWVQVGRDEGAFLRGALLAEAEAWLDRRPQDLTSEEKEFIQKSIEHRDHDRAEQEARRQRDLEAARQLGEQRQALRDTDVSVRTKAAEALGKLGDVAAVPALVTALSDENVSVRRTAAEALGKLGDVGAVPELVGRLRDENASVRRTAAEALGKMGSDPRATAAMKEFTEESEQQKDVAGIDFSNFIANHTRDFTGRHWALAEIERWLADPAGPRFFMIIGGPGSGKTALASRLTQVHRIAAHHFCDASRPETVDPRAFLQSIILQLIRSLPGFGPALLQGDGPTIDVSQSVKKIGAGGKVVGIKIGTLDLGKPLPRAQISLSIGSMEPGAMLQSVQVDKVLLPKAPIHEIFRRFLVEPLRRTNPSIPVVIVVDGLDEGLEYRGRETIVDLLANSSDMPSQVRFVLTSRPAVTVLHRIETEQSHQLLLDAGRHENLEDIRHYVNGQLAASEIFRSRLADQRMPTEIFIERITAASGGNFLYVVLLLRSIAAGTHRVDDFEAPPRGLTDTYHEFLRTLIRDHGEQKWRALYRPILGVLAAVQAPVTSEQLGQITGIYHGDVHDALIHLRQLLVISDRRYSLYHSSIVTFLSDQSAAQEFWIDLAPIRVRIAEHEARLVLDELFAKLSTSSRDALKWAENWGRATGAPKLYSTSLLAGLYQDEEGLTHRMLTLAEDASTIRSGLEVLANQTTATNVRMEDITRYGLAQRDVATRIYLSSTYIDLKAERQVVYEALRRLGCDIIAMEDYVATDQRPMERCIADIRAADIYIGVIAWRYGYIPDGYSRSITELEFDAASESRLPRLVFLLDERAPWPEKYVDQDVASIKAFRERVASELAINTFTTSHELATLVSAAVARWQRDHFAHPFEPTEGTEQQAQSGVRQDALHRLPLSDNVQKAVQEALIIANRTGGTSIGPQHLLAGLLALRDALATKWITDLLEVDRESLYRLIAEASEDRMPLDAIRKLLPPYRRLRGHTQDVEALVFSPDGQFLVSGSADCSLRIWNVTTRSERANLLGHTGEVTAVGVTPDGRYVISGSSDHLLQVWDLGTRRPLHGPLMGHTDEVTAVAVTPDGRYVISGSSDHLLQVWDLGTRRPLHGPLMGHTDEVTAVAVTPDGRYVISGSSDHTLQVWDLGTRRPLHGPLMGHTGGVTAVAVTPDGRYVISGSSDHTLQVWDLATGHSLHAPLMGHTGGVTAVAVTPDGGRVISTSLDKTLKVWDLMSGQQISSRNFSGEVGDVALAPDGRTLAVAVDQVVQIWALEQLIAEVHEAEAPHVPAYRLLLATNRPTYTVGERIRVQIELQTATAGSPESFELPTGVGELHCFAASSTGLQVIEPGAASIVVTPGSDQPLVAAIQLQATLPGVRSCSFNFFADDRLIPVNSNISIMVSPPLASGERPSILPTLDVRVAARPEFVLRVELDQPEGDDSSHHLTYRLTSRVPDLQVQNEIVGKVVLHDSDLRRIQTLVRGTVKAAAGLQPEDGRERMISLGRYLYDHLFPTTEAATWREYLRKAEAVWQERRGSGKLPPTWLIIEDEGVWLPWELMVTYRAEEAAQIFWAERYRLSRWVEGLGRPLYGEVPVGDVALAHYKTLQAGEEELDEELNAWRTLLRAAGAEGIINVIKPDTTVYALHILRHMEQLTSQLDIRPKDSVVRTRTPEEETPRAQLDLRAKRPVVTLSILDAPDSSGSEATDGWILPDRVLPFLRAGASAVLGPWWPTCDVADRAFWTNFYDLLEGGVRLGEAVWQARLAVQRELPDRPDWLAYTLFGDPRATPYVPEASAGYATVECLNPDEPLRPGKSYRFRATLGSQPPAWYRDRLVVAEAPHGELRALFLAPDLQTTLPEPVAMHPVSRRLHQATVELTPVASGQYPLLAQILQGDEHLKTLQMSLNVGEKPSSGQANG